MQYAHMRCFLGSLITRLHDLPTQTVGLVLDGLKDFESNVQQWKGDAESRRVRNCDSHAMEARDGKASKLIFEHSFLFVLQTLDAQLAK